ncbi:DUF4783 domain-containing protein [Echinicola strongylocentroti]|uniref:DUF4783 domain-containing protein n=2 Tax=Echinicola strongylocentroti TaxID=1795355 RepID=A0A2Z4IJ78_9BACT|nr:DUF4783 domain-containing protein [Echinicola strongylocentroti]
MILCGSSAWAQRQDAEEIAISIKAGSSKDLAVYFDRNVELSINGNEGDYSKNQAELVIRDFFKKFPPSDFDIVHKGSSGSQIEYFIGTYDTTGTKFRILIKCKKEGGGSSIYSMDITKE